MIDKLKIISTFRSVLLNAEIVELLAEPGTLIGLRDGDFNPLLHTRPADPAVTPILDVSSLNIIEAPFDQTNLTFFVSEVFLPSVEMPAGTGYTNLFAGIMQYSVYVPYIDGNHMDIERQMNTAKYIQDIFDPKLANLTTSQANVEINIDNVATAPQLKVDSWNQIPVSVNFRTYEYN